MVEPAPFHPDLRRIAAVLPRGSSGATLMRLSRRLEPLQARRRIPEGVEVESLASVTVRIHRPPTVHGDPIPALLWLHGGGYVGGGPAAEDGLCGRVARELGVLVAAVAYRRAPEHPFPTPLHDCHDALVWLSSRPDVDSSRIAIGGASAGGGLAAALALLARERGEVQPAFQLLTYPMLDDRTVLRTDIDHRPLRLWNNKANRFGWESYLGCAPGSPSVSGLAAPARHDDLSGLPPAWMGVAALDLFRDEDLAYAERLRASGTPCAVHVVEGAFHGFDYVRPKAGVTLRFRAAQLEALAQGLGLVVPVPRG